MISSIVSKLLTLLTAISQSPKPLTFSEIVTRTGMNKSTIHRLLSIGIEEKVLRYEPHKKVYLLGNKVFDLVRDAYRGHDIQELAFPEMVQLQQRFDCNVTVGVPNGLEVIYLKVLESSLAMSGMQSPGMREPVHCSASGKALLAFLPPAILDTKLENYRFEKFTERTVASAAAFEQELEFVRHHGYGKNDREEYDHFLGISAPIFNYLGEPIAVLNLWSVYPRHKIEHLEGWSAELVAAAQRVTELVGGITPDQATV